MTAEALCKTTPDNVAEFAVILDTTPVEFDGSQSNVLKLKVDP